MKAQPVKSRSRIKRLLLAWSPLDSPLIAWTSSSTSSLGLPWNTPSLSSRTTSSSRSSCLWTGVVVPARRTLRFLVVFLLLLCAAESLLTVAVYLGYSGSTYLQRVRWHRNGSLTFSQFQRELGARQRLSAGHSLEGTFRLPRCPLVPPSLQGALAVDLRPPPSFSELAEKFPTVQQGGSYKPSECKADQKLAVIVPYRDRRVHLKMFLRFMHPFLQTQQLDYTIFVIELKEGIDFNRALLFNIGFREATRADHYTCFVFHDVDLLPEDDRNLYKCTDSPRHLSVAVDRMKYRLPYKSIFGGVTAISSRQFQQVNGFSNLYFGWGGEDDDMFKRLHSRGFNVTRYTGHVARYKAMAHAKADKNPSRLELLYRGPRRFLTDGLNSLNYTRLQRQLFPLYTWLKVSVDQKLIMESDKKGPGAPLPNPNRFKRRKRLKS